MTGALEGRLPAERAYDPRRLPALRLLACAALVLGLGAVLARRAVELRREIERTAVRQTWQAMRVAVDAEAIVRELRGGRDEVARLAGSNPIALLDRAPAGYVGESTDARAAKPGSWRFDPVRRELVYSMRDMHPIERNPSADSPLRFKIAARSSESRASPRADGGDAPRLFAIGAPAWLEGSSRRASQP